MWPSPTMPFQVASAPLHGSIADMLLVLRKRPASGIFFTPGIGTGEAKLLSYPEIIDEALCICNGLRTMNGTSGLPVALLLERPRDFIPAFWACILGGYIPCPVAPIRSDPDRWSTHLSHINHLLDHPLFVSTGDLLNDLPTSIASADLNILRTNPSCEDIHRASQSDTAILMLTSGSTGNSKAVELSHGNLLSSMSGRAERQRLSAADTTFNWIAFDHVAALLESHMVALYAGAMQLHSEPAAILSDPLEFLRLIDRFRVTLAFAPNFLLAQINSALEKAPPLEIDLSCLKRIVTGGEANVVETGRRFLRLLAPCNLSSNALWPAFGMTETCAASVYSQNFPDQDLEHEFASVGFPIDGLEIRVFDASGTSSARDKSGELQLRGPMIFHRYRNNEAATRAAFTSDGWFRTGDLGCIEGGALRLVARSKDSIIVNGVNYFSQELETKLQRLQHIEQPFVAAFPTRPQGANTESLVIAFATPLTPGNDAELHQLLVAVRDTTIMLWGFRPAAILPLPKASFPKTSLGKIQRSLLRTRYESGDFQTATDYVSDLVTRQMGPYIAPDGALEGSIANIFGRILGIPAPSLSASASFFDLGGTSLDILKLTGQLERELGFRASLPVVLQNPSVRLLARHASHGAGENHRKYEPIVPLQSTGKKTPLFCVHPGNGEIFSLVNVAKYFLNDRPFYAIRPPGFNDGEPYFQTFEEILSTYLEAILQKQPSGPYALAGYSFGCSIAFEIAKELDKRGHAVAFVGCIDAIPRYESKSLGFNLAAGLALVTDLISLDQFNELSRELRPTLPSEEDCKYVLKFASPDRLAELSLTLESFSRWARVAHSIERILYEHRNIGTVESMTIFRSEGYSPRYQPEWSSTEKWRSELTRWDNYVLMPRYVDVSGHHFTIMGPKHVADFQSVLRSEIDEAFERHSSKSGHYGNQ